MRVATTVMALILSMVVLFQSYAVGVDSSMGENEGVAQGGAIGLLLAFFYLVGGVFALGIPAISAVVFLLAGVVALAAGASAPEFAGLQLWGWASIGLAAMALVGHNEKGKSAG
jgi:hypothetical protein